MEDNPAEKKSNASTPKPSSPDSARTIHTPVLLQETISLLAPSDGGIYIDATLGLGGHAERILAACGPTGRVIGFEWDASALELARKRLAPFGARFYALHRNYADIRAGLAEMNIEQVDGLLLDLGVSSLQFDSGSRGFSFQAEGPLDMRMDRRLQLTAEEIINDFSREELADIFFYYGEERQARRIAARIVEHRADERIRTTSSLARLIAAAIPKKYQPRKIHPATKVFQALRIAVNKELDNLMALLENVTDILKPGGRLCIITFHSLEDRLVKWKLRDNPGMHVVTKKPVTPDRAEIAVNPRARSAKLRAAYREG